MALPNLGKAVGHSFGLEFDGVQIKHIQEVSGLKLERDVIELTQTTSDGKHMVRKLPGRFKMGEITLTRSLVKDDSFENWIKASGFGTTTAARKGGHVTVFDYEGTVLKRYTLINAWPKSLEIGAMMEGDTSVLTEKLVLTYESLQPE
jgi:phage tail-like protein